MTAVAIAALAYAVGLFDWRGAIVAGLALALSATAIALQILEERGQLQQDYGQRAFAILLFQDMAVVPLLALLPLLARGSADGRRRPRARPLSAVALDRRRDRRDRASPAATCSIRSSACSPRPARAR